MGKTDDLDSKKKLQSTKVNRDIIKRNLWRKSLQFLTEDLHQDLLTNQQENNLTKNEQNIKNHAL